MNAHSQASSLAPRLRVALHLLLGITLLNYAAQIPYYIDSYGVRHIPPAPFGVLFLIATLALFLAGYVYVLRAKLVGGGSCWAFCSSNLEAICSII